MAKWKSHLLKDVVITTEENICQQEILEKDDLLIKKVRGGKSPLARFLLAKKVTKDILKDYYLLRANKAIALPEYIIQYFSINRVLDKYEVQKGMFSHLQYNKCISEAEICIPDILEQKAILDICQRFHKTVALNTKINSTLISMAMTLYQYLTKDISVIQPITNILSPSSSLFMVDDESQTPSTKYIDVESILKSTDFSNSCYGEKLITWGEITDADFLLENEYHFGRNDYTILDPKEGISPLFVYCSAREGKNNGSANNFPGSELENFSIKQLSENQIKQFHKMANPWFYKMQWNLKQNEVLQETLGTLSSGLFSGKIIAEIEQHR